MNDEINIRALFSTDKESMEEVAQIFSELEKEFNNNSDRGIAIIAVSILELVLEKLLKNFLVESKDKNEENNLFSNNGALSNFSNKIVMSFRLGLISSFEKDKLSIIRQIRNTFAHKLNCDFKSEEILSKCKKLAIQEELMVPMDLLAEEYIIDKPKKDDSKEIFKQSIYILLTMLATRQIMNTFKKRVMPDEFKNREDFHTEAIKINEFLLALYEDTILRKNEFNVPEDKIKEFKNDIEKYKEKIKMLNIFAEKSKNAIIK